MKCFNPHLEILSEVQQWVYPQLRNLKDLGFVLYGGSALALQLGQRQSVGFEFFLHGRLKQKLLRGACPLLGDESLVTQIQDSENTVTFEISPPDSGKGIATISFFGNLGYGRVGEPRLTEDGVLVVASALDIFATKLKGIIQRPSTEDFADIIRLIKSQESLLEALEAASILFGTDFSPMLALKALSYFDELKPPLSQVDASFLIEQVSNTVKNISVRNIERPSLSSKNLGPK
jgi:hypothetical protein